MHPMAHEPPLLPGIDFVGALEAVQSVGGAFLAQALNPSFCQQLQSQLEKAPFESLPRNIGPVSQVADLYITRTAMEDLPAVADLRDDLVARLTAHTDMTAIASWWPNEAYVQRYTSGASVGVSPHVDSACFAYLVAVFTTKGRAQFALCRDRGGEVLTAWETIPGSLVLLRGAASAKCDDRPFHSVHSPTHGTRFSVTLRMNTRLQG